MMLNRIRRRLVGVWMIKLEQGQRFGIYLQSKAYSEYSLSSIATTTVRASAMFGALFQM